MANEEIWLPVVGYEGFYEVSSTGKVKSVERFVYGGRVNQRVVREKEMAVYEDHHGYLRVNLNRDNRFKGKFVHRLVAEAFIKNPSNYPIVNHMDGNKKNNNVNNLEWCTYKYNTHHAIENGLTQNGRKVMNVDTGIIYANEKEASRQTGISRQAISKSAIHGKGRTHWVFADTNGK